MKHIFIVNPIAGSGRALKVSNNIKKICEEEMIDYQIIYTNKKGEATKIASKIKGRNIVFAVGGDGTLNEVLNGLMGSKNILGVIPAGSGNDFYRSLEKMNDQMPLIDIGEVNNKYFINVVSIGIDAEIGNNASVMKKIKVPRTQIYNASIVYTFFKYKFKDIDFEIDNTKGKEKCTILTVCNGEMYGGGYKIAPEASLCDGYFDVYFVKKISKLSIPLLIGKLKNGTHGSDKAVKKVKANKIKFKCDKELVCGYDGETLIAKKFKIKMHEKAMLVYNDKKLIKKIMRGF